MATKTIGTSSRDYATFALYASYLDGLNTLSAPEQGDVYNDSEFTPSASIVFTGFVTSSSNTVTINPATGQGFKDASGAASNPLRYDQSKGVGISSSLAFGTAIDIQVDYVTLKGLQIKTTDADSEGVIKQVDSALTNVTIRDCILEMGGTTANNYLGVLYFRSGILENVLAIQRSPSVGIMVGYVGTATITNCTVVRPSDITAARQAFRKESGGTITITNCAGFGFSSFSTGSGFSGSNNASDQTIGFGTSNQESKTYSSQFVTVTDASRDFRSKTGADLINNGTTGTTGDIIGQSANGTKDIGAWELQSAGGGGLKGPLTNGGALIHGTLIRGGRLAA